MSTILGTKGPTLQPRKFGYSKERGHYDTRMWEGGEAEIRALIPTVIPDGVSYDVEELRGDLWRLTSQYATPQPDGAGGGAGEEIAVTWELLPKDAQKDLLASSHALVAGLTQSQIEQIRRDADDPLCGALEAPTATGGRVSVLAGDALKVLKLLKAKVDSVEVEQPVLQLTWIVPQNVTLSYAYENIGRIYTTASLISVEAIPGYISSSMTAWTASFSNPSYGTGRLSLVFGWKKRAPTQRLAGFSKREISQTWEFGLWSTDIYGSTL